MRALKRAGASLLALGVVAASMVMTATVASAHTGTLATTPVCQSDGTYKITYTGTTANVPASGLGHVATLSVGEIKPAGTKITGAPATVTGNTNYTFSETVPGTTTLAQATAFLLWGDGVKSDPIGQATLSGNCKPPAPVCVTQINNNQLSAHYTTDDFHATVSYTGQTLCAGVNRVVSLNSYQTDGPTWQTSGTQKFIAHDQVTIDKDHTTGSLSVTAPSCFYQTDLYYGSTRFDGSNGALPHYPNSNVPTNLIDARNSGKACAPTPVAPSGDLTTSCVNGGGQVTTANLNTGTAIRVRWRLVSGTDATHTTVVAGPSASGPLTANGLADVTKVWLQVNTGNGFTDEGSTVTTGNCTPVVVAPSGSFTVVCSATGANVTIGTLGSGTGSDVVWTLTYGSASKIVSSGAVVAVPASAALALKFTIAGGDSQTAQSATAQAACAPTAVLGVKIGSKPTAVNKPAASNLPPAVLGTVLPHTGAPSHLPWTLGAAALFLMMGSALIFVARKPEVVRVR